MNLALTAVRTGVLQVARDRNPSSNVLYVDRQLVEPISSVRAADGGMGLGFTGGPGIALDVAVVRRHDRAMNVEAINIGPSDAIAPVQAASALAGKGLQGDRHFYREGAAPGEALTLIEAEVLESVGLTGAESRRQVVVRGVRLNDLVGKRFRVGNVECLGVELCEPCLHLQQLTRPGIIKELIHRAGLNADILNDGRISVGDAVVVHGQP
jgi:MOSC domain-containing protein YiiM